MTIPNGKPPRPTREAYIGVVSLAIRMHAAMSRFERFHFDSDGDPLARVARDFNACGYSLQMLRNGETWMLTEK